MSDIQLAPHLPPIPRGSIKKAAALLGLHYHKVRRQLENGEKEAWDVMLVIMREHAENLASIKAQALKIQSEVNEQFRYN